MSPPILTPIPEQLFETSLDTTDIHLTPMPEKYLFVTPKNGSLIVKKSQRYSDISQKFSQNQVSLSQNNWDNLELEEEDDLLPDLPKFLTQTNNYALSQTLLSQTQTQTQSQSQSYSSQFKSQDSGYLSNSQSFSFDVTQNTSSFSNTLNLTQNEITIFTEFEHDETQMIKNLKKMKTFVKKFNKKLEYRHVYRIDAGENSTNFTGEYHFLKLAKLAVFENLASQKILFERENLGENLGEKSRKNWLMSSSVNSLKSNKILQIELAATAVNFFFASFFDGKKRSFNDYNHKLDEKLRILTSLNYCLEENVSILETKKANLEADNFPTKNSGPVHVTRRSLYYRSPVFLWSNLQANFNSCLSKVSQILNFEEHSVKILPNRVSKYFYQNQECLLDADPDKMCKDLENKFLNPEGGNLEKPVCVLVIEKESIYNMIKQIKKLSNLILILREFLMEIFGRI